MNESVALRTRGLDYCRQGKWNKAASLLAQCLESGTPDPKALTWLGVCWMRLGDTDQAVRAFQRIQAPLPHLAALNWAALLCHEQRYPEALNVLRRVTPQKWGVSEEALLNGFCCILFRDMISLFGDARDLNSLELRTRGRLLKLMQGGLRPLLAALDGLGWLLHALRLPNGMVVRDLAADFRRQSWVRGLPVRPDFLAATVPLEQMAGYTNSHRIYRDVFQAYLDYWLQAGENVRDLLQASVKPADAHALYCIVRSKKPEVVLEVGTFVGFSTCLMAQAVRENGRGSIVCVDPHLKHLSVESPLAHARCMLTTLGLNQYVQFHEGFFSEPRGLEREGRPVLGTRIADLMPPIDVAFIDGDHATTALLQDFMLVLPHLSQKATVVLHDVRSWPSVRQGILTLFQDDLWKRQMRYIDFAPMGNDGVAMIEIDKTARSL